MKKFLALFLCLALALGSLSGCTGPVDPDPTKPNATSEVKPSASPTEAPTAAPTEAPTEPPTEAPTEPPAPDVKEAYAAALELLPESYTMTAQMVISRQLGAEELTTVDNRKATVWTSEAGSVIDENWTRSISGNAFYYEYVYAFRHEDGVSKLEASSAKNGVKQNDSAYFTAEQSAEDALAWLLPLEMVTPEKYDSMAWADDTYTEILFLEANDVEYEWTGIDCSDITNATVHVYLDEAGAITRTAYYAEYDLEGMHVLLNCDASLAAPEGEAPQALTAEDAVNMADLRVVPIMDLAGCAFLTDGVTVGIIRFPLSQAAGQYQLDQEYITLGTWDGDTLLRDHVYSHVYSASDSESGELDVVYSDGTFSYVENDEDKTPGYAVDIDAIEDTLIDYLYYFWLDPELTSDATLRDEEDCWLIEFSLNKEGMQSVCWLTEYSMFQDGERIEDVLGVKFKGKSGTGYLSVDKGSGMPLHLYVDFSGSHTYQYVPYTISMQYELNILAGNPYAYDEVTEKAAPSEAPDEPVTPLFYQVSDDQGHTMWLLGTIHVGDSRTSHLPQEIYDALLGSEALAVEIDAGHFEERLDEDETLMDAYSAATYYQDGTTLYDHLDEELEEQVRTYIKKYGGQMQADLFNYNMASIMSLWDQAILPFGRQLSYDRGVDFQLSDFAEEHDIPIWDVEDYAEHIATQSNFSEELQLLLMKEQVGTHRAGMTLGSLELFEAWCRGDEAELQGELTEEEEDEEDDMTPEEQALYDEYQEKMMNYRNRVMLDKAAEYLASGKTIFMAVGLAHLMDEGGLLQTLRDAGYTVTKVEFGK